MPLIKNKYIVAFHLRVVLWPALLQAYALGRRYGSKRDWAGGFLMVCAVGILMIAGSVVFAATPTKT